MNKESIDPGKSGAAVLKATGKSWPEWLAILDEAGAANWDHTQIAAWVDANYPIGGWWAQSVTVGYERLKGRREVNEKLGGFSANVNKTYPVSTDRLYAAFVDEAIRDQWLEPGQLEVRTATPNRSARFNVLPGATRINVGFIEKGPEKPSVAIEHKRIETQAELETWRAYWKEWLNRLGERFSAND